MNIINDFDDYRDPNGYIGLVKDPEEHSTDNSLLFSILAYYITQSWLMRNEDPINTSSKLIVNAIMTEYLIDMCEKEPGCFLRYPKDPAITSWDDHLAVAIMSGKRAYVMYNYAKEHNWTWGDLYLGRFPLFRAVLKIMNQEPLTFIEKTALCGTFLFNLFEPKTESSGRILMSMSTGFLLGKYKSVDLCINIWKAFMLITFGSFQNLLTIYYGKEHPITKYSEGFKIW